LQTWIFYSSKFARLKNGFFERKKKKIPYFGLVKMEHELKDDEKEENS